MSENELDPAVLDDLVRLGTFAADGEVVALGLYATGAERTRTAIRYALKALVGQGYLIVAPQGEWPPYFEVG